jgi:4-hydroxyproline epimerase
VAATAQKDGSISVDNVISFRSRASVPVDVPGLGLLHGDIAWGGNWFFLCDDHGQHIHPGNVENLTRCAWAVRKALAASNSAGDDGGEIDHIELFGPPSRPDSHSKNFVLCPGGAYDRSPCGTGTSAKLACLFASGELRPGETWVQESIIGSTFRASLAPRGRGIVPTITGSAWLTAEAQLLLDETDPFRYGIPINASA